MNLNATISIYCSHFIRIQKHWCTFLSFLFISLYYIWLCRAPQITSLISCHRITIFAVWAALSTHTHCCRALRFPPWFLLCCLWKRIPPPRKGGITEKPILSLLQTRMLIGFVPILSWDCHFLPFDLHQMSDFCRYKCEAEQTFMPENKRLYRSCVCVWRPRRPGVRGFGGLGSGPWDLQSAGDLSDCLWRPCDWKTHHQELGQSHMGGHQHKVSKQMALHDVMAICCCHKGAKAA